MELRGDDDAMHNHDQLYDVTSKEFREMVDEPAWFVHALQKHHGFLQEKRISSCVCFLSENKEREPFRGRIQRGKVLDEYKGILLLGEREHEETS